MNCWVKREKLFVKIENAHSKYTHPFTISMAHTHNATQTLNKRTHILLGGNLKTQALRQQMNENNIQKDWLGKKRNNTRRRRKNLWSDKSLKPKWWLIVANVRSSDLFRKMTNYPFICKCPKEMERKKRMVFSAFPTF